MNFQIQNAPAFSVIEFQLSSGEAVVAQPDSMISMTSGMRIRAATGNGEPGRGWGSGFRSLLGGESFLGLCLRPVVTSRHYCWRRTVMVRY